MKKLTVIISFFTFSFFILTSCGPAACDCADLAIEALEGPKDADDLSERKQKRWIDEMEEKLEPCEDKANDDKDFDREVEDCFEDNLPSDFDDVEYTSDLGDYDVIAFNYKITLGDYKTADKYLVNAALN